jgi:hypothetical protein
MFVASWAAGEPSFLIELMSIRLLTLVRSRPSAIQLPPSESDD